ncbi:MAG: hypothetical protein KJZ86_27530 [Caldilineaceae bacterium]|nr:hypothetical protein [Caldilineaceae bacterium]HRJ43343.1 hypothetical protein [Caldilineaceae bacterium]
MRKFGSLAVGMVLFIALILMASFPAGAANDSLPPRPTLTPTPDVENRAAIRLLAGVQYENAWAVVEWQGGDGA